MSAERSYSAAQAAAVAGLDVKAVHNAIGKRVIAALSGDAAGRRLSEDGIVRLKLWSRIGSALSAEKRETLFETMSRMPAADRVKADDFLIVDVAEARKQVRARLKQLEAAEKAIHSSKDIMGGAPVFAGTRIPVRLVANMLKDGATAEDILSGYPSLTERLLELAQLWVAAYPAVGRPSRASGDGYRLKSQIRRKLAPAAR